MADEWDIVFYADEHGREPCKEWLDDLPAQKREALKAAIDLVLTTQGVDVAGTGYGKALGEGLYEFRLRWTAAEVRRKAGRVSDSAASKSEKILLRVFFCTAGKKIILLLCGYDKARDNSSRRQDREIKKARKLMVDYKTRQARERRHQDRDQIRPS